MSLNINTQISWPIFIVDDHPIYGEALQACLQKSYPDHMVGYYSDSQQALDEIPASFQQGILIIDINMPDLNGIAFSKKLRKGGLISESFSAEPKMRSLKICTNRYLFRCFLNFSDR